LKFIKTSYGFFSRNLKSVIAKGRGATQPLRLQLGAS